MDWPGGWSLWFWWVLATALGEFVGFAVPAGVGAVAAWPLGVAVPFIGLAIVPEESPTVVWVVVGVVSGVLMGVVVGAITGMALVWLLRTGLSRSGKHTVQT